MNRKYLLFIVLPLIVLACHNSKINYIVLNDQNEVIVEAGQDMKSYLSKTYPNEIFEITREKVKGKKNIVLELSQSENLTNDESFIISGSENVVTIKGKSPRALVNGTWGLLKYLGWDFYLAFETPPVQVKPLNYENINIKDTPLKDKRIIFNWHNFLSGCSGWDYEHWKEWIENASKIGYNTIMVHAYGNNPMHSYTYNGLQKEVGYLPTTQKGRDWGTQHVNDVRLLYGGEIFDDFEFGSVAAKVPDHERVDAATSLMQKVFKHAARKGMGVCFALDVDTWTANPQNIIETLPEDALIEIAGYKLANPEHPESKKYYKSQIEQLLNSYPEINILSAFIRNPNKVPGAWSESVWHQFDSQRLPEKWRSEYFKILKEHPELKDERPYPVLYAISKIISVYREILDETRPDIEVALGSWQHNFAEQGDPFIPAYCSFVPIDYSYIFDKEEVIKSLASIQKNRKVYPVVWAHHDDHGYLGRPYQPYENFNTILDKTNSNGFGILHWTTHPLDPVFNNYCNQTWSNSENLDWQESYINFVNSLMMNEDEHLVEYFKRWFENAPMFGRETSSFFLKPEKKFQKVGYKSSLEVVEKAKERLKILEKVNVAGLNSQGVLEYNYQVGMEEFIVSFFNNHYHAHQVFSLLNKGKVDEAARIARLLNPEETISMYSKILDKYDGTRGEEGVLISLNLRWFPAYIDLRQRTGLEDIRINFQPTSHEPLAQGAGKHTFFVDEKKNFWLALGEHELNITAKTNKEIPLKNISDSWIKISEEKIIPVRTMRKNEIRSVVDGIEFLLAPGSGEGRIEILDNGKSVGMFELSKEQNSVKKDVGFQIHDLSIKIKPFNEPVKLAGLVINVHK
jgi:hypothetical protein